MKPVSLLARAERVARQVADRMTDEERRERLTRNLAATTSKPAVNRWRPSGLSMGGAGLAVMCAAFGEALPDHGWELTGHRLLGDAVAEIESSSLGSSLFTGLVGAAAAVWLSSRDGTRYQGLLRQLDSLILPLMRSMAQQPPPGPHTYDVVNGAAGWVGYLRTRPRSPESDLTALAVAGVLAGVLSDEGLHRMGYRRARPGRPSETVVDSGLAHGVAGVLAALSLLRSHAELDRDEITRAIRWGGNWLAGQARTVGAQILWPDAVTLTPREGRPDDAQPLHAGSWCHGSSGVARALYLAGVAVGEPAFRALAVEAMRGHCAPYPELASPSVCHGLAGQLLLTMGFAHDTGDPVLEAGAARLTELLFHRYRDDLPLGFREVEAENGTEVDHPGLLRGSQGVALALLAGHLRQPPRWGRLLLMW